MTTHHTNDPFVRLTSTGTSTPGDPHDRVRDLLKEALLKDDTPFVAQLIRAKRFQDGMRPSPSASDDQKEVKDEGGRYLRETNAAKVRGVGGVVERYGGVLSA